MSKPEVLLIDLSSLYWTAHHAVPIESSVSEAATITMQAVRRCAATNEGGPVAICLDQGRSFRKELAPDYKINRPEKDAAAYAELGKLIDRLRGDGFLCWGVDGFEADDVIATAAHAASAAGHPICIASADKDLLQLLALPDSRALRTYGEWPVVRAADVVTKFGIEPEGLGDWLALTGDKSDNVKGVPSVGPTTATKLLLQHFSLTELYAKIDALTVANADTPQAQVETKTPAAAAIATPAVVDKLWRHKADAMLARELVELRTDAPIKFEEIFERRDPKMTTRATDANLDQDADFDDVISTPEPDAIAAAESQATTVPKAPAASGAPAPTEQPGGPAPTAARPADSTALVTVPYRVALEPRSGRGALELAAVLYESRLYAKFPTVQSICAVIMRGREMGLGALASLDAFFVVEGRPYAYAYLIISQAKAADECEYFQLESSSDKAATWVTKNKRNPRETRLTHTIEMATAAGLTEKPKSNWNTRREEMLIKTAGSRLARIEYPAAALGLLSVEEVGYDA
jgi:5'-3' exonuclease